MLAERRPVRVSSNARGDCLSPPGRIRCRGVRASRGDGGWGDRPPCHFRRPYVRWATWTCTRALGSWPGRCRGWARHCRGLLVGAALRGRGSCGALLNPSLTPRSAAIVVAIGEVGTSRLLATRCRPILLGAVPLVLAGHPSARLCLSAVLRLGLRSLPRAGVRRTPPPRSLSRSSGKQRSSCSVANERLERASLSFATALVAALDARDQYTAGHSAAVAVYARDIADRLGLPEEEQQLAHLCGLVHDVGKVGLPAGLLEKPGTLTLEERRRMEEHSEIGERILAKVDDYAEIARIVRHHHERMDGNGYPDRLPGAADSAPFANHRGRGCIQRDDLGPTVPRCDA